MEATMNEAGTEKHRGNGSRVSGEHAEVGPAVARASGPEVHPPAVTEKPRSGRTPMIVLAVLVVAAGTGYAYYHAKNANLVDTDDAQVESDVLPLAARAAGQVLHVRVHDNDRVHAGQVLLEIDSREYQARVDQATADLDTQRATAAAADSEVQVVEATARGGLRAARANVSSAVDSVQSASAQIAAAQAGVTRAQAQAQQTATSLTRVRALRSERAVAQAELDNAQAADDAAQAAVAQAQAQLANATASRAMASATIGQAQGRLEQSAPVEVLLAQARARNDLAHARVRGAEAALALAQLSLSYTTVTAPSDGTISRLAVHEGQLIQPGQAIAELVPTETYAVANFKETQVGRMHAGQPAEIHIDAFPGRTFHGAVESISAGTGSRFSLLPPDNASGNFVKVVQRVPVRIRWTDMPRDVAMRAGLSADVTVEVTH